MTLLDGLTNPTGIADFRRLIPSGALVPLHPGYDEWMPSVLGLLIGEVAAGRPAVYVHCGAYGLTDRTRDARILIDNPLFRALVDDDEFVSVPSVDPETGSLNPERPQDASFWCGIPTLQRIAREVSDHEERFGPAMVILDQVEDARPYRSITGADSDVPAVTMIDLTADQARAWLAQDLARWAASRLNAPTIASSGNDYVLAALDAEATTRMFGGSDNNWFDDDGQKFQAKILCTETRQDKTASWTHAGGFRIGAPE